MRNPYGFCLWIEVSCGKFDSLSYFLRYLNSSSSWLYPKISRMMSTLSCWPWISCFRSFSLLKPVIFLLCSIMFLRIGLQAPRNFILDSALRVDAKIGKQFSLLFIDNDLSSVYLLLLKLEFLACLCYIPLNCSRMWTDSFWIFSQIALARWVFPTPDSPWIIMLSGKFS